MSVCQLYLIIANWASSPALPQLVHRRQQAAKGGAGSLSLTPLGPVPWHSHHQVQLFCSGEMQGPQPLVRGRESSSALMPLRLALLTGTGGKGWGEGGHVSLTHATTQHMRKEVVVGLLSRPQEQLPCTPTYRTSSSVLPRRVQVPLSYVLKSVRGRASSLILVSLGPAPPPDIGGKG